MKRLLLAIALSAIVVMGNAKSLSELWATMPDSLLTYVDHNHRLEMTEFISMGLKGDVDNLLGGKSMMDSVNADYIQLTLNESASMQIKLLPVNDGDSIICLVRTYKGPETESVVTFYDQQWQRLPDKIDLQSYTDAMLHKPSSMSDKDYEKLVKKIDFSMVTATVSSEDDDMVLILSAPSETSADAQKLRAVTRPVRLEWNGNNYIPVQN